MSEFKAKSPESLGAKIIRLPVSERAPLTIDPQEKQEVLKRIFEIDSLITKLEDELFLLGDAVKISKSAIEASKSKKEQANIWAKVRGILARRKTETNDTEILPTDNPNDPAYFKEAINDIIKEIEELIEEHNELFAKLPIEDREGLKGKLRDLRDLRRKCGYSLLSEDKERAEPLPPEYIEALAEVFKGEELDPIAMPKAEELTEEYFDKMYPAIQRKEDKARGLLSFRPGWWNKTADSAFTISEEEEKASKGKKKRATWGELFMASMKAEAEHLGGSVIFTESIQKPKHIDGSQQYGTVKGTKADKDPLLPIIKEVFGDEANRFNLSWDQITNELLPKVKAKIQNEFTNKHLTVPDFEVILTPAIISNLQTTLNHPENSQTNTYEQASTVLLKQDGTDSDDRLVIDPSEYGGAGGVSSRHRGFSWYNRGFRLSVVFGK